MPRQQTAIQHHGHVDERLDYRLAGGKIGRSIVLVNAAAASLGGNSSANLTPDGSRLVLDFNVDADGESNADTSLASVA